MSKRFMGIVALMAAVVFSVSPVAAEMDMEVGAKGGLSFADVYGDDVDDTSMRTGFAGGGFFTVFFNENFGGRLELLYSQKGAKADVDTSGTGDTAEFTTKLDYVEIPVLAVAQFPVSDAFSVELFAGPVFAFNTLAEVENGTTEDRKDFTKSFDFAGAFGLGGSFAAGGVNIIFEGRATIGFMNYPDEEDDPTTADIDESDQSAKTIAYGAMVGVSVPLNSAE